MIPSRIFFESLPRSLRQILVRGSLAWLRAFDSTPTKFLVVGATGFYRGRK
jgi:hypothetical protein